MKLLLIAALLIASAACADAQNYGFDMYVRGGAGLPDAPDAYAHSWQTGPHVGTGIEFTLSQRVSIGMGIEYLRNPLKKDRLLDGAAAAGSSVSGGVLSMFSGIVYFNYRMLGQVVHTFPFITVDAGVTHMRITNQTVDFLPPLARPSFSLPGSSETAFRAAWGLGVDVPLSANVALTVGGKYVFVFTDTERRGYVPIDGGFKFVF